MRVKEDGDEKEILPIWKKPKTCTRLGLADGVTADRLREYTRKMLIYAFL